MMAAGVTAIVLSLGVLAAHFLFHGNLPMVALCVFMPVLLLVPQRVVARVLQAALVLGALEWIRTLVDLVQERMAVGAPYLRSVFILAGVAAFTLAAAFAFRIPAMRKRYGLDR